MRGLIVALAWLCTYVLLARYGVLLLPASVARALTLSQYLAAVQLLTLSLGVALVIRGTRDDSELRRLLLPLKSDAKGAWRTTAICGALLLAPALYASAHSLGMYLAFDTLLLELAQKGRQLVQQQTGALGQSAARDTLFTLIPFTVLIVPIGEELLFRGAIQGAFMRVFPRRSLSSAHKEEKDDNSLSESELALAGLPSEGSSTLLTTVMNLLSGGLGAALVSSLVFGLMHADTPGGLGIVRVTSAATLGLCCGLARYWSGALLFPIALHAGYNLLSLGTLRGWFTTASWPTKYGLPTSLLPIAGAGLVLFVTLHLLNRSHLLNRRHLQNRRLGSHRGGDPTAPAP